jgi:hypothetical protein
MAYIQFTDEVGLVTLVPSYPAGPARRFRNWTPNVETIGPRTFALGTGRPYEFAFRRDYVASFEIPGILPSQHEDFMRFKVWAMKGCPFDVYTEDDTDAYYECRIAPNSEPEMSFEDTAMLEYAISVKVRSIANTPMICNYRG